jgi:hypothetical protein
VPTEANPDPMRTNAIHILVSEHAIALPILRYGAARIFQRALQMLLFVMAFVNV